MTKQEFQDAVSEVMGRETECRSYADFLACQSTRSPLKTDNKLARQSYINSWYQQELSSINLSSAPDETKKENRARLLADTTALKKQVRTNGVTKETPQRVEALTGCKTNYEELLLVGVTSGEETPLVDGTNTFETMYS
jgi:hypothetical protein